MSLGAWVIATTHHRSVAVHAETAPGMSNASVELDPITLRPTYHVTPGVPGRSYAIAVAEQVGLPRDILDDARSLMEPQHVLFEDWLLELQASRRNLKERIEAADVARAEADASRRELESRLEEIEASRADVLLEARRGIEREYEEATAGAPAGQGGPLPGRRLPESPSNPSSTGPPGPSPRRRRRWPGSSPCPSPRG